ncbi:hypothetical protein ABB37_09394 [Leptomonas pyrrhocoris]|uniref:Uncharacterized protein n=1 Tax=Leptomonas pyrrhocoris TaxID=157538 RepID=A0A0N0DRG4_LEPPY|nr:hypothetical protein ABB37_09394 [Leptomonas pyrrhocoris]XP_015652544.1 hypothetical protein ABB37_09394 [Leptomonas pyrrhocoris]KPA74104.1 hypothetical protein ABB37_09394 [Leptomonas pyrrhocoris]KPA74105.1 hypothetical protein ABB37_09394 [Leptomonas pyrrhocoris]|eukprot:XP_015652543.1 hypothetical protein ABB37_09394 [Leptomonas pyrrhocoris]
MPNPDPGNERAAAYVDYYASPQMVNNSVNRLYYGGVERKKRAEAVATEKVYPKTPSTRRSKAQLENYLRNSVQGELLRRQQHRAALQQALHPDLELPPRTMTPKEMERHVEHVYNVPLIVRRAREAEMRRIFGTDKDAKEVKRETVYQYHRLPPDLAGQVGASASPSARGSSPSSRGRSESAHLDPVVDYLSRLEKNWRQPSASVPHDDNRRLLVSQYDYYADPRKFTEMTLKPHRLSREEWERHMNRLELLSRPLRVNPQVKAEEGGSPAFRVSRKVEHKD